MFKIGDRIKMKNVAENSTFSEHLGKIGKVMDYNFSTSYTPRQFLRVQWEDDKDYLWTDLMASRFEPAG